ncbi:mandelate racemase/muconate lactonizing enzyme family protein [Sulfitobacter geojensis]|uniref:Mandelate racemase/muconate lactonizing enzyme family protein n=1 Tax=Sulfitobacter geojensis TaxID=1342299 RepID=A0AAE2W201_9RHOB|nr:mandelate racemase/muconate lactonizing enzyme family protein [Sulfitobacter geojensis]MBM1691526.1 mandelate racemase/muconate lactonizing enzyme family protein [Sulfitobacter geojensis]MBM1695570.1 mandelate racemase/muconate lactonizing enzyme family protein [Sulfitobacter geojensis]MBM1707762.1 mandelate racemase/muconate lactonizing enzyme family protein [Sulfitobacter geojensis]MBM1711832.1 mandelate racemase/muconate lactonizing enzyme family protein [Sulfitobacter geojensis]MBM17158
MAKIDLIELYYASADLPAPFSPAWVPGSSRMKTGFYLIRIATEDGVEGWSGFSASGKERAGIGDGIADAFLGTDPTDIDMVHERIKILANGGMRHWWIEPAFWDIKAKLAGLPVYKLLGGTDDKIRLYASSGEVRGIEARREEAEARYSEGFDTFKIRVHDWDEAVDIAQIQDIAEHMKGRMKIAVDCNQAFRMTLHGDAPIWDLARAKRFADAAAESDLLWVEEPLYMEWYDDMAELAAYSRVTIAGGELHTSGYPELRHMALKGCYNMFQPDAMWSGGIKQVMQVGELCRELGLGFSPHSWGNGLGFLINAHCMAASGFAGENPFEYPYCPPGWTVEARDAILSHPSIHDNGWFHMPQEPGLGIEIDHKALEKQGVCFFRAKGKERHWMPEKLVGTAVRREVAQEVV